MMMAMLVLAATVAVGTGAANGGGRQSEIVISGVPYVQSGPEETCKATFLTVDGGATQGAYSGLVLVGGSLTVESGAQLQGIARVRGSVHVAAGSRIAGNLCTALLALEGAPGLRRPVHLPESGWLRPS